MKEISPDVVGDARVLARTLRWLLQGTGMGLNQYAGHIYVSKGVVSRYLGGLRLPDGPFLGTLLTCWGEHQSPPIMRGDPAFAARFTELTALYRNVLKSSHPAQYEEQLAADDRNNAQVLLEEREHEVRRLEEGVADREHQLEQAKRELRELASQAAETHGTMGKELELLRNKEVVLRGDLQRLQAELSQLQYALDAAIQARDEALAKCSRLERQLEAAQTAADRERLAEEIAQLTADAAEAALAAERRRAELEEATRTRDKALSDANALRAQAAKDAQLKRAEAEALFEETRSKAASAALDFETKLAQRREQSERDLAARQGKAEKRLAEIEHRAEQLRLEAEKLRTEAEGRARMTVATAQRQSENIVADANAKADRIRLESERELTALTNRRDSINAQMDGVRDMLAKLTGAAVAAVETAVDQPVVSPAGETPILPAQADVSSAPVTPPIPAWEPKPESRWWRRK